MVCSAVALIIFAIGATLFTAGVVPRRKAGRSSALTTVSRISGATSAIFSRTSSSAVGVNGRVAVNNQTMGGDPAVGKDKSLRIFARNRRNEERGFNYNEGGFVEVRMFTVRRDDRDDHPRTTATVIGTTPRELRRPRS